MVLARCYLIGAVPFGLINGDLFRGIDIRKFGSGNIGASNILRTLGAGPAITVFILDTAKGVAAVVLTTVVLRDVVPNYILQYYVVAGAILVILGHNFSVFLGFRGGKGVATSLGVIIGFAPIVAVIAFLLWGVVVAITRYISVGSIASAVSVPIMMYFSKHLSLPEIPTSYQVCVLIAAIFVVFKHRSNIQRLRQGTEVRIWEKVNIKEQTSAKKPTCPIGNVVDHGLCSV